MAREQKRRKRFFVDTKKSDNLGEMWFWHSAKFALSSNFDDAVLALRSVSLRFDG